MTLRTDERIRKNYQDEPEQPSPAWEQGTANLIERLETAKGVVCRLASGKSTFRMSIPPQSDDTDMLLCAALTDAQDLLREQDAARVANTSRLAELREQLKAKADGSTANDDLPFGGYKRVVWQLEAELETLRAVRTEFRKRAESAEAQVAALSAQVRQQEATLQCYADEQAKNRAQVAQLTQEKDKLKALVLKECEMHGCASCFAEVNAQLTEKEKA